MRLRSRHLLHATRWGGCHGVTRRDGRSGEDRWLDVPRSVVVTVAVPVCPVRSLARRFPGGPRCSTPRRSSSPDRLRGGPSRSVTRRRACWDGLGAPLAPPQSRRGIVAEAPGAPHGPRAPAGQPRLPGGPGGRRTARAARRSPRRRLVDGGLHVAARGRCGAGTGFRASFRVGTTTVGLAGGAARDRVELDRLSQPGRTPASLPARDHCRSAHSHSTARSTSTSPPPDTSRHHQGATR